MGTTGTTCTSLLHYVSLTAFVTRAQDAAVAAAKKRAAAKAELYEAQAIHGYVHVQLPRRCPPNCLTLCTHPRVPL